MQKSILDLITPAMVLAIVMGTLFAGIFHLFMVTKGSRLLVSWTVSVASYCVGVILCDFLHISILPIGPIDLVLPSALSIASMSVARLIKL